MARGKHGASVATKRTHDLEAKVEALTDELAKERADRAADAIAHNAKVRELRSRINAEAKSLRDARFNSLLEHAVTARVKTDSRAMVESRVLDAMAVLARGPFAARESVALERTLGELASALGVPEMAGRCVDAYYAAVPGSSGIPSSRATRRISAKMFGRDPGEFGTVPGNRLAE